MRHHLAEINIAKFRLPVEHPANAEFIANLDRVNAMAEAQPGFVWRFVGSGNSAIDVKAFDDPNIAVNMSVWTGMEALANFVYHNPGHREIMRRRREWFDRMEIYVALWWIPAGRVPTIDEGKARLATLARIGPSAEAFLFHRPFPAPDAQTIAPIMDKCA
jgi:hypothetical protein